MNRPLFPFCAVALAVAGLVSARADVRPPASGWRVEQRSTDWKLSGFDEDLDLSAIAAWDAAHCLVGSDELIAVQPGKMDGAAHTITAGALVPLLANPSGKKMEVDIEGIAVSRKDNCYYVTGSHGVGKKKGEFEASRASVFRVPVDPATGEVQAAGIRQASLVPCVEQTPEFKDHLRQPLQLNGFNIEGLTFRDGTLYFGVRGPNLQGETFVIEVNADALFAGGSPPACTVHHLPVGEARGIREITAIRDGFLVLTGNASAEATKKFPVSQARMSDKVFELFLWKPGATPETTSIGVLPRPFEKAEGMLVLEDTDAWIDVLVIFDGAPQGGPRVYRIYRKTS